MTVRLSTRLPAHLVEKPWGRTQLPPMFGDTGGRRIGEVWFQGPADVPLLAKYIFTSQMLSIQNHPNDRQAQSRGLKSGKDECWYVLEAEPGATLGLGLRRSVAREELRQAALNGSIVELLDWKPVQAGDFYYVPAGTVHAIGAGIAVLEFQQNADVTYRIYDFGRPRELHLDEGVSVAIGQPYGDERACRVAPSRSALLVDGPHFSLAQVVGDDACPAAMIGQRRWVLPIDGSARAVDQVALPGECLLVEPFEEVRIEGGRALIGAEGAVNGNARYAEIVPERPAALHHMSEQFASSE